MHTNPPSHIAHEGPAPGSALLLAIETSGVACSAALAKGYELLASVTFRVPHIHDRMLATMVERLMADHALRWEQIHAVAVSAGPGSFTGLRIGVSFAKALCVTNQPALIGVPTLQALALEASSRIIAGGMSRDISGDSSGSSSGSSAVGYSHIVAAYPSQRGQFYAQRFNLRGEATGVPLLVASEDFSALLDTSTLLCSPAPIAEASAHALCAVIPLSADFLVPLAMRAMELGAYTHSAEFHPLYVQDFVPKISPSGEGEANRPA
ncbi:MAG: tRNA ((37)-N6)-threonylcarbamoyltransferase complex dimerization subunit type 1 TsaB [Bacteroidota bacterium]